jgi:isoquinoline 1-oxidoreductase alpha subunit
VRDAGSAVAGKKIVTIEGLGAKGLNRVQQAWIDNEVPQCGYCQAGMIMAGHGAAREESQAERRADRTPLITNLCRCGTYGRVRKAIHALAGRRVAEAAAGGCPTVQKA